MQKYDLIIIGSGPAGLSAAIYGKRAGLNLVVLEKQPMSGGQILNTYEVDNYLGLPGINGFDMGMQFRDHADRLGAEFVTAEVTSVEDFGKKKLVHTDQGDYEAGALILATGAEHAHLGVEGETEFSGKGVSYCATCDGAFFRGKTVVVVGGGDVALEDAIYLARFCKKVYCVHRRDTFRGAHVLQQELKALENVEILYNHIVTEIHGENSVNCVTLQNVTTEELRELQTDGVFIAVGIKPNTGLFHELMDCREDGYVIAGEDCATSREGIFAAGDIRYKPLRQIVTAVADGANAAVSAGAYLNRSKTLIT